MRFGAIVTRGMTELVDTIVSAEQHGFDAAYVADHPSYGIPDPWTVLAFAAARTSTIRLGTHVVATPLHHPTRLANQVATVDVLSGGRAVLGLGTGYTVDDFAPYGWVRGNLNERFEQLTESIQVMKALWAGGPAEFSGKWFSLALIDHVRPLPLQRPGPPIIIGVNAAGGALAAAVRLIDGVNTWQLGPTGVRAVADAVVALGGDLSRIEITADVIYLPGASEEEAEATAQGIATRTAASGRPAKASDWHADGILWGDPAHIRDQVRQFAEAGVAEITIAARTPDLIPQFAHDVITRL